ncbi:riboflavin synthase [Jeotgalibacillus campisalis]|uniref:Riboflavin synthase n=1 Tax=Jeotgalibacillus campisalis TaxID=220754 RepID=A0A0C2VVE2_9BACL|nr:riboflavin synthase [Jeotgalibacillus campisalis]KIL47943.1 riboflavin synthase subunit alpha [Jeotgalibacillus campisalis]
MFTGIVEEVGAVVSINRGRESMVLSIEGPKVVSDVHLGDSISVNGVCLTVTGFSKNTFTVDVMPETVKASTIHQLKIGSKVNLERAMSANGRFGGHFVSGHIDGTGTIRSTQQKENAIYIYIEMDPALMPYFMLKGSVSVDGTSLTIFDVEESAIMISLIPQTVEESVLGKKRVGDLVNIECDMIAKYIHRFVQPAASPGKKGVDEAFLQKYGFMN